jgi:hypothetical protein
MSKLDGYGEWMRFPKAALRDLGGRTQPLDGIVILLQSPADHADVAHSLGQVWTLRPEQGLPDPEALLQPRARQLHSALPQRDDTQII